MTTTVGIREFRAGLADYIDSAEPVAVTRHGSTVGWFIPTPAEPDANLASLRAAADALDKELSHRSIDVDAIVAEYKEARRR